MLFALHRGSCEKYRVQTPESDWIKGYKMFRHSKVVPCIWTRLIKVELLPGATSRAQVHLGRRRGAGRPLGNSVVAEPWAGSCSPRVGLLPEFELRSLSKTDAARAHGWMVKQSDVLLDTNQGCKMLNCSTMINVPVSCACGSSQWLIVQNII